MIPLCYVQCNKKIERVRVVRVNAVMLMMMSWWYLNYGWPGVDGGRGRGRRPDQGNGSGHSPTLPWNYSFCNEVTGFVTLTMTMLFLAHGQGLESWQDTAFLGRPPPPRHLVHLVPLTVVNCHYVWYMRTGPHIWDSFVVKRNTVIEMSYIFLIRMTSQSLTDLETLWPHQRPPLRCLKICSQVSASSTWLSHHSLIGRV